MLSARRILAGLIVTCACLSPLLAGGNANFILGSRAMDDDRFWDTLDTQAVIGVSVDFGAESWPVNIALSVIGSGAEDRVPGLLGGNIDITARVGELGVGANKTWGQGRTIRPFVSGGLVLVIADLEGRQGGVSVSDDGGGVGFFIDGGVFWRLGKRFNIGVDARIVLGTEVTLFQVKTDTDYAQLGLILGFGWGD